MSMGLLRKAAYLGDGGMIGPRGRNERDQARLLAAAQARNAEETRRARAGRSGTRAPKDKGKA